MYCGIFAQVDVPDNSEDSYEEETEAQEEPELKLKNSVMVGGNFQVGFPQGKFSDNVNYTGFGFGGNLMWKFKNQESLYGGIDFSLLNFDFEGTVELNGFNEQIETKTRNSIVLTHAQIRFYPEVDFFIQPFVEGLIGAKGLLTRTTLTDVTNGANGTISSNYNKSEIVFSVGGAIGFEIALLKKYLFLEARCAYLKGTSAEYYARKKESLPYIDPIEVFELRTSPTDLIVPQIGIKFLLGFGGYEDEFSEEEEYFEEDY